MVVVLPSIAAALRQIRCTAFLRSFNPYYSSIPFACLFSSFYSSLSSPCLSGFSNAQLHKPLYFPTSSSPGADTSDFESYPDESTDGACNKELFAFLQLLSQANSRFSTQEDALAFLRSSSTARPTKHFLCSALWALRRDWESALLAFRWAGDGVLESPWAWHLMIWVLGKQRRFDFAWRLVQRMHRKSLPTRRALVIMMERHVSATSFGLGCSYAAANEVGKAIKTFHALEKFKVNADHAAFYSLLRALCRNKNIEEAEELLYVKQKYFPLETAGFNIILDGWCNILIDVIEAKRVWREMAKCCITPDDTSYTFMISCFSKLGNLFDSLRLVDEMKKRGWIPNLKVHNCLIFVLTRENCIKEAHEILNRIIEGGLQPDVETYNSMVLPLCEAHKVDEAQVIMKKMISTGVYPSVETYHAFIMTEDLRGVFKLIELMKEKGCGPNGSTFLLILEKFSRSSESESALRMWGEMKRYHVIPGLLHYRTIIKSLAAHGWIPKAMEFYDEMKTKGFPADPEFEMLFKSFLIQNRDHWGRSGKQYIIRQPEKSRILP
ncbi:Pentatricopeptide repeat-containing protein [Apostasia shenzhenica]|uniref:Pentatricopeptide repeat-containing protein n=1 Tax=Apostasia shenzhenica TaxID=1088818 RepID=A0A2I0A1I9_9ASPA|nr:Pentatricopeptide repeat-containing protein [Apostasia shenzhenica]